MSDDIIDRILNRPDVKRSLAAVEFARERLDQAKKDEPLTLDELKQELMNLGVNDRDAELVHEAADLFLLRYIDDEDVRRLFLALKRWYA